MKAAQERLTVCNTALVKSIVKRYMNRHVEYDDLFQIGCMGLVKAIQKFDLSYDVRFSTYAVPMIAGEIKRFLRDDGMIKVSRTLKELAAQPRPRGSGFPPNRGAMWAFRRLRRHLMWMQRTSQRRLRHPGRTCLSTNPHMGTIRTR